MATAERKVTKKRAPRKKPASYEQKHTFIIAHLDEFKKLFPKGFTIWKEKSWHFKVYRDLIDKAREDGVYSPTTAYMSTLKSLSEFYDRNF